MKITHAQARRLAEITLGRIGPVQIPVGLENCLIRTDERVNNLKEASATLVLRFPSRRKQNKPVYAALNDLRGAAEPQEPKPATALDVVAEIAKLYPDKENEK